MTPAENSGIPKSVYTDQRLKNLERKYGVGPTPEDDDGDFDEIDELALQKLPMERA